MFSLAGHTLVAAIRLYHFLRDPLLLASGSVSRAPTAVLARTLGPVAMMPVADAARLTAVAGSYHVAPCNRLVLESVVDENAMISNLLHHSWINVQIM